MPLKNILDEFQNNAAQCERLVSNAHKQDGQGTALFSIADQQQITIAGFLNLFIAWETFLESSVVELMLGRPTVNGSVPVKYVSPVDMESARKLIVGVMKYFDYGNHSNFLKLIKLYFEGGYPFEPHLSSIYSYLDDLRTMRNSCAHISSTTQIALEALAFRLFSISQPGITIYQMLTAVDPKAQYGETIFSQYKTRLLVTAELIAKG